MDSQIIRTDVLGEQAAEAIKTTSREDAVLHVADQWHVDPVRVESALAKRESNHSAAMECGA